jgi:hypothetical protein
MNRLLLIALFGFALGGGVNAQVNELGLTIGGTYYLGDLNPTRHFPRDTKLAGGIIFRHNITDRWALRLQGLYGTLQAYDSDSKDTLQLIRDLHFRSRLFEASLLVEVNFFKYRSKDKDSRRWTPFVFGGLCYFRANPQAQLDDTWYDLQPLGTEGQGTTARPGSETYKVDQIAVPFGAGLKFNLGKVDVQLEWGMRRTGTDYIDDVSGTYVDNDLLAFENGPLAALLADPSGIDDIPGLTNTDRARGDSNTRDWYNYTGFTITYVISRFSDCEEQYDWMRRKR